MRQAAFVEAQGAEGYEEELVARLRGFRPDFGLVATSTWFPGADESRAPKPTVCTVGASNGVPYFYIYSYLAGT